MAGTGRLHPAVAGAVRGDPPGLPAVQSRRWPRHPDPDDRRRAGTVASARRPHRRLVPRWLRPGEEPRHVDAGTVRPAGAAISPRHHPGYLHHHRLGASLADRGRLRHEESAGHRQEVGSDARGLQRRARRSRSALVRPPGTRIGATRSAGDRRRPGRQRHGPEPGSTGLAGQRAGTPRRPGPGGLGQSTRRAVPQAFRPRHRPFADDPGRLRLHPPLARAPAAWPGLGCLRRVATGF